MGAGWSAATGLHVQCDKAEYVAGDTVRAIVALNVVKPIELESVELQVCQQLPSPPWQGLHETRPAEAPHRRSSTARQPAAPHWETDLGM